jgi:hypothetical protein
MVWLSWQGEGAKGLARGLTANATLHTLSLGWNGLENQGGGALGEMLATNMGLRKLDLSHARLGSEACLLLAEGLKVRWVRCCKACDEGWVCSELSHNMMRTAVMG